MLLLDRTWVPGLQGDTALQVWRGAGTAPRGACEQARPTNAHVQGHWTDEAVGSPCDGDSSALHGVLPLHHLQTHYVSCELMSSLQARAAWGGRMGQQAACPEEVANGYRHEPL